MAKRNSTSDLEKKIWDAACIMRGHISASDYRKVIIGILFLKSLSFGDTDISVPPRAEWDYIVSEEDSDKIGEKLNSAIISIENANPALSYVLPRNYADGTLDNAILWDVVKLFDDIKLDRAGYGRDYLGRMYENCIAEFAAYEGKKGGEYFTPPSIVKTIVSILQLHGDCSIYDPCCGTGGMFAQSVDYLKTNHEDISHIRIYGQEANADTWKMAKMNMVIHGLTADLGNKNADTFTNDLHPDLKADFVLANPPFNYNYWSQEKLLDDKRWIYGLPSRSNANYAWLQHCIYHLNERGRMGIVLSNGASSEKNLGVGDILRKIIEDDIVEGIISMPSNLFYSIPFPVTIWIINKDKEQPGKTLFVEAKDMGTKVIKSHRELTEENIQLIADAFEQFRHDSLDDKPGFCNVATTEMIAANNFDLNIGNYITTNTDTISDEEFRERMTGLANEWYSLEKQTAGIHDRIIGSFSKLGIDVLK
ncbi:MAG: N-6 DNA methylase [Ruminiclostridium sp.]|nr:N-6 DNA methylase [Ruminiclostridium sp.]